MTNSSPNYTTPAVKDYSGFRSDSNNVLGLDLDELLTLADSNPEVKKLAEVVLFPVTAKTTQSPSVDPMPAKQADVLRVDFVGVPSVISDDQGGVIETNDTAPVDAR